MKKIIFAIFLIALAVEVSANNNVFEGNNIEDCEYAMFIKDKINVTLTGNWLCSSGLSDVYVVNSFNINGSGNSCNTSNNYNDSGEVGCDNLCVVVPVISYGGGKRPVYPTPTEEIVKHIPVVKGEYEWNGWIICILLFLFFIFVLYILM